MSPRRLQVNGAPHDRFGRSLPPGQRRRRRHRDDVPKLDALDDWRERGFDRGPHGRLAGAAGTRDQEKHANDYRNGRDASVLTLAGAFASRRREQSWDAEEVREELDALWAERWPTTPPVGHLLRDLHRDRWARFHALPESKRYPDARQPRCRNGRRARAGSVLIPRPSLKRCWVRRR